jgi:hypothetical protein
MPQAFMVFNSRPVPPTAAARYRKSLRLNALSELNEVNELNDLDCFTVLLSIYFLTSLPEKPLGDLLAHSSDIASRVPRDDKK